MLDVNQALRSYLREEKRLQKGRWKLRQTVYVFKCVKCPKEIEVRKAGLGRMSGRCRTCADRDSVAIISNKNRKQPYEALLTFEQFLDFIRQDRCRYCSVKVEWSVCSLARSGYGYHLDRKDNAQGYSVENCVVCCWSCNQTKATA